MKLTKCIHCGCYINPAFGEAPPGEYADRAGTQADPRAPGDWDNVCDVCNYRDGKRGGPMLTDPATGEKTDFEG